MKRTPLRRSPGPQRKTRLKPVSEKRRATRASLVAMVEAARRRSAYRCEAGRCQGAPLHPHHIWPRGRGGPDAPWNLAMLCFRHHRRIHDTSDPAWLARNEQEARAIRARIEKEK